MSSTHPSAWRTGTVLSVAVAMVAALVAPAAGASEATAPTAPDRSANRQAAQDTPTAARCFSDEAGDAIQVEPETDTAVSDARADIVEQCLSYEDRVVVSVKVAEPTNPATDPNWQQATFVGWFLDVDADGEGDFYVDYSLNRDGTLGARVLDVRDQGPDESPPVACDDVPASYDGAAYTAGPFRADCLDSPGSVEPSAGMSYDADGSDGPRYEDRAPDEGAFHDPVARGDELCAATLPAGFADRSDVAEVHRPGVDCLFARGITLGVERDGVRFFVPRAQITRGQFAAFVARAFQDAGVALPEPQSPRFDDVDEGHTFDEVIHRLAAAGILEGVTADRFVPGSPIRRDQTASVLSRAFAFATDAQAQPDNPGAYFRDTEGNVHSDNIDFGFEEGLVQGIEAPTESQRGVYAPAVNTQRQQMATVLFRFLTLLEG